jgi:aspartyl/asparaginyl-tRNA synthetase
MKKILMTFLIIGLLIATTACSVKTIADVKNTENVGKKVTVQGKVDSSFKLGSLSGYSVKDDTDTIGVSAQNLPKDGETVTVTGILMKDTIFGYYIKADE